MKFKALFVCSANFDRSPTAERMFDNWRGRWETKSAGIKPSARHPIEQKDVDWADIILVMEPYQQEFITNELKCSPGKVRCLHIEDNYRSRDPAELAELEEELLKKAAPILDMEGPEDMMTTNGRKDQ